jgi:hypothetical protein
MLTEARKPPKEIPSMKDSRVADLLPKELKIESHTSLAVAAIDLDATSTPQQVTGKIRNNGKAVVPVAVLELDLLDVARTKMGSVSTRVQNIGPGQEAPFRVTVPFSGASNVLVRHLSEEPQ